MKEKQSFTSTEQKAFMRFAQQVVKQGDTSAKTREATPEKGSSRFAFKLKRALLWKNEKN